MTLSHDIPYDISQVKPHHPGAILRHMIPSLGLDESGLARELGMNETELKSLLTGQRRFLPDDVNKASQRLSLVAKSLLNIQVVYDFYEKQNRRPDKTEFKAEYAKLQP